VCASCNPTGARPAGVFDHGEKGKPTGEGSGLVIDRVQLWALRGEPNETDHWLAGTIPGYTQIAQVRALYQSHYLSNDGRLFFNGADALVPLATPKRKEEVKAKVEEPGHIEEVGVTNVYEYEANNTGSCHSPGGCVGLLSSGTSPHETAFLDATPSGNEVFFLTAAQLPAVNGVTQDVDTNFDVYDAHHCQESSPCSRPALNPASSCEDAPAGSPCKQPPPLVEGELAAPLGATIPSTGNITSKVAVKGSTEEHKTTTLKPETRQQKLAKALKACKTKYKHNKHKRQICEKQARKNHGPKAKHK
jgi:hypothetical protein